jgi:hypothetical protein
MKLRRRVEMVNRSGASSLRSQISIKFDPDIQELCQLIAHKGFCRMPAQHVRALLLQQDPLSLHDWPAFQESWLRLSLDGYMGDGGRYRKRRYATLSAKASSLILQIEPHQPHYQSRNYNQLNGGVSRHFEPIEDSILRSNTMSSLLIFGCDLFGRLSPHSDWHIEVHQFRIEADGTQVALPTPEGPHRDGVDFVIMLMIHRFNVVGGATTIYDLEDCRLGEFTLADPLEIVLVDDKRIRHAVAPIAPLDPDRSGYRDVFVATFRDKSNLGQ